MDSIWYAVIAGVCGLLFLIQTWRHLQAGKNPLEPGVRFIDQFSPFYTLCVGIVFVGMWFATQSSKPAMIVVTSTATISTSATESIDCDTSMAVPSQLSYGGTATADFTMTCRRPVKFPALRLHIASSNVADSDNWATPLYEGALSQGIGAGWWWIGTTYTYSWRWAMSCAPTQAPEPGLERGDPAVVYAKFASGDRNSAPALTGSDVTTTIVARPTFSTLSQWLKGLGGVITALIGLIAALVKFIWKGNQLGSAAERPSAPRKRKKRDSVAPPEAPKQLRSGVTTMGDS